MRHIFFSLIILLFITPRTIIGAPQAAPSWGVVLLSQGVEIVDHGSITADGSLLISGSQLTRRDERNPTIESKSMPFIVRLHDGAFVWAKRGATQGSLYSVVDRGDTLYGVGHIRDGDAPAMIALTSDGNVRWAKQLNRGENFQPPATFEKIVATPNKDGLLLVGNHTMPDLYRGLFVMDVSKEGAIRWQKRYTGLEFRILDVLTSQDGYYIVGTGLEQSPQNSNTYNTPAHRITASIIKIGIDGTVLWSKSYEPDAFGTVSTVAEAHDGGIMIGGSVGAGKDKTPGAFIARIDRLGNIVWQQSYTAKDRLGATYAVHALAPTEQGYIAVTRGSPSLETQLFAINKTGKLLWVKRFRTTNDFGVERLLVEKTGYVLVGSSGIFDSRNTYHPVVLKTDRSGNISNLKRGPLLITRGTLKVVRLRKQLIDTVELDEEESEYILDTAAIEFIDAQFTAKKLTKE